MSDVSFCRICGRQLQGDDAKNVICSNCLYGQKTPTSDPVNLTQAELPADFETFQKQTGEMPGVFSDAVLEKVRSEASSPLPTQADDPDNTWSWQSGVLVWLFSVVAILFFPLIFLVIGIMYLNAHGHPVDEKALKASAGLTIFLTSATLPAHLVTLLVAWIVVTRFGKRPFFETLGWKWHPYFQPVHAISIVVMMLLLFIVADVYIPHKQTDFDELSVLVNSRVIGQILFVVLVAFSAPLVEEVVYRGALFTPLEKKFGTVWAIVIVASLFGGVHVQQYWPSFLTIGEIMTLSIILTCIRAFTRSLLPCVAVHFLFNGIQVALPYVFSLLKYVSNR